MLPVPWISLPDTVFTVHVYLKVGASASVPTFLTFNVAVELSNVAIILMNILIIFYEIH